VPKHMIQPPQVAASPLDKVADVLNRCAAKGLDPMWALNDELSALIFADVPNEPVLYAEGNGVRSRLSLSLCRHLPPGPSVGSKNCGNSCDSH
jgi:hypothetical protein